MSKIVKNYYYFNLASIVERVISFILIAVLARYLGAKGFGVYSLAFALSELYIFFFEFGLSRLIAKKISNKSSSDEAADLSAALMLQTITSAAGLGALAATAFLLHYPEDVRRVVYLISISVMLTYFAATIRAVFIGKGNAKYDSVLSIVVKVIIFVGVLAAVFLKLGLPSIAVVFIFSGSVNHALSAYLLKRHYFAVNLKAGYGRLKDIFRETLPFMSLVIFSSVYLQIDSIIISKFADTEAVGLYSAAYKLVLITFFISTNIVMATYPAMGEMLAISNEKSRQIFVKTVKYLLIFALPIATGAVVLSRELISLIYGKGYEASAPVLSIIIWWVPLIYISQFMGGVLTLQNREKTVAVVIGVGAALNLLGNFIMVPLYGIMGAALMKVMTEGTIFLIQAVLLYRGFIVHFDKGLLARVITASAAMGAAIYFLKGLSTSVPLLIAAGACIYLAAILALGLVDVEEARTIFLLKREEKK